MNGVGATTVSAIVHTLGAALTATLLVAIFTVAVAEFARPQLRRWRQKRTVERWLATDPRATSTIAEPGKDEPAKSPDTLDLPEWLTKADPQIAEIWKSETSAKSDVWNEVKQGSGLTNELFMRRVQNEAHAVLEQPAAAPQAFAFLSRWASPSERAVVVALDKLGRANPQLLAKLFPAGKQDHFSNQEEAARLSSAAAAQDAVGRSVERQLDALQLDLTADWSKTMQYAVLLVGIVVAAIGTSGAWRELLVSLPIGVLGAFVASWLQTLLVFLTSRRSS